MKVIDRNGNVILEKEMPRITKATISSYTSAHVISSGRNHKIVNRANA